MKRFALFALLIVLILIPVSIGFGQDRTGSTAGDGEGEGEAAAESEPAGGTIDAEDASRIYRREARERTEALLETEEAGLKKTASTRPDANRVRISRLLIVSGDGSERFYRQVEKLRERFSNRLEVLLLDCDEAALGAAAFGPGRRARALLIHHKEAVVRFLSILDTGPDEGSRDRIDQISRKST